MTELPVTAPIAVPQVHGEFNRNTKVYQLLHLSWQSFRDNILGWGWIAKLALVGLLMIMGPELLEGPLGVPRTPSTGRVIPIFSFFPVKMTVVALITIYVGQIVWRERDARMGDISDAAPVPDGVLLASKLLSVLLMLVLLNGVFMVAGIVLQVFQEHLLGSRG